MTPRMLAFALMRNLALILILLAATGTSSLRAEMPENNIYAQKLIDEFTANNLDLITVAIHAYRPGTKDHYIIASTTRNGVAQGKKSEQEDFDTLKANKPDEPILLSGSIYDIILPFHDASGKVIGTAHIHVKPAPNVADKKAEAARLAVKYENEIAKRVSSEAQLFEPASP